MSVKKNSISRLIDIVLSAILSVLSGLALGYYIQSFLNHDDYYLIKLIQTFLMFIITYLLSKFLKQSNDN